MAKNTFFFSHDSGARNDDKIIAVRMRHKAEGYAVYFMILEKLLESSDYMSIKDYNILAFDFRVGADVVKSVVEEFGLFEFTEDGKFFYSKAFINRMDPLEKIKHKNYIKGIKGHLIRNGHLNKEQVAGMTEDELIEFSENLKKTTKKLLEVKNNVTSSKEQVSSKEQKNQHKIRQDKIRQDKIRQDNIISSSGVEEKTEQIPPPPNNEISSDDPHIDLVKKILLQQKWIETFRINLKIPESKNNVAIRRLLHEFLNHLVLESKVHAKEKDFKSHFTAWCRKLDRIRLEEIFLKKSSASKTSKQPNNGSTDYYFLN